MSIDNGASRGIETLAGLTATKSDTPEVMEEKRLNRERIDRDGFCSTSHCEGDEDPLQPGAQTLSVNAAVQGDEEYPLHPPWLVDVELPKATEVRYI